MNKIIPLLFLLVFALPSNAMVQRTLDSNTILYFADLNYSTSINVTLNGNDSYIETIPSVFDVYGNYTQDNTTYVFDNVSNNYSVFLNLGQQPQCVGVYNISGSYMDDNLQNVVINNSVYVVPVTLDTVVYSLWDTNFNNKIDKLEMFMALSTYFGTPLLITKVDLIKVINMYIKQSNIVQVC